MSPLPTTAPDANFESPRSSSARLRDPPTTPPPSRAVTNRIRVSPSLSNQKSSSPSAPPPKAGAADSLGRGFGMWAGGAMDVIGETPPSGKQAAAAVCGANQWSARVGDGLVLGPMKIGLLGGPANRIATRIPFYKRRRMSSVRLPVDTPQELSTPHLEEKGVLCGKICILSYFQVNSLI